MIEIRSHYFKTRHDEGLSLISGLPLPPPNKGPYHFVDCKIHPRLRETMMQMYTECKFTNTEV